MAEPKINFGILGCAEIARKVSRSIMLAPNATLFAIASRSLDKAAKFARENAFPQAKIYGSYEALLDDPTVDAVYMPLPTSLHARWAVRAAQKKKHVLLEKPVALNVAEFDKIVAACVGNGVQIMDGTMWMHHPRTAEMKEFLSDKERFGELKTIHANFTYTRGPDFLTNSIRVKPDLDSLGALEDQGWYCIKSILFITNYQLPKSVTALPGAITNEFGVLLSCGASLLWEDGKLATFNCSFLSNLTMDITAIGTTGTLHVHDYVILFQENEASITVSSKSWFDELATGWVPKPSQQLVMTQMPQEAHMVKEFCRLVGGIKGSMGSKSEMRWPEISRKTQLVLDCVKLSIENGYAPIQLSG